MANRSLSIAGIRAKQAIDIETRASALRIKLTEHLTRKYGSGRLPEGMDYHQNSRTLTGAETQDLLGIVWELAGVVHVLAELLDEKEVADGD